ncbi:MAG: hypothetical protein AB7S44_02775 [Spirochaetales bacterium]
MKVVKYYDSISGEYITIEVNNAVAESLKGFYYEEKEQKRQIAKHEFSVDGIKDENDYIKENIFIDTTPNPYDVLEEKEGLKELTQKEIWLKLLNKALKKLSKEEWFIIRKIFWQNYKKIEISRKYNILPSLISYRYKNAINKLRNYILENEKLKD